MHGVVVGVEGKKWLVRWDIDQETTTIESSHLVKESDMHNDETPEKPSETMKKSDDSEKYYLVYKNEKNKKYNVMIGKLEQSINGASVHN